MGKIYRKRFRIIFKINILVLLIIASLFLSIPKENVSYAYSGSSNIVMRADTLEIIEGNNIHLRLPMASTTKTMTALVVIDNCKMDDIVVIPKEAVGVEGSSVYVKEGEKYTIKELLYGLMLRSGNDAAVALALHVAGSIEKFAEIMNIKAEELGLTNTHFINPHGLHDKNHYTSAYDLCKIGCIAMRNPFFKEIVGTKFITIGNDENKKYWSNKNKILTTYKGGNGIKTGYTKNAGRCLIASAERNGITVVSVVLNRSDMFEACRSMMDRAFLKIEK